MQAARVRLAVVIAVGGTVAAVAAAGTATGSGDHRAKYRADLVSYEEVPAVSSVASGEFRARLSGDTVEWTMRYRDLEGAVAQAHIHFGQTAVNGGVAVFLCSNLGNGPEGTQPCPASPATVSGSFDAGDVVGPAAQGIAPGEFDELVRAMNAGVAYANVHSTKFPGGEIRGQLDARGVRGGGRDW